MAAVSLDDNVFELGSRKDIREWLTKYVVSETIKAVTIENGFDVNFGENLSNASRLIEEIEQLKELIEIKKSQHAEILIEMKDKYGHNKLTETVLYWVLAGKSVTRKFNINPVELPFQSTCNKCGETNHGKLTITSWANIETLSKTGRGKDNPSIQDVRAGRCACDRLADKLWDERRAEIYRQEEERKTHIYELKTMPYREYLQTDEWKATRKQALKRAKFKCQLCGGGGQLNVHHNSYERRGEELTADLIVLCADCHRKHHNIEAK
jgi:5-methylcytosine-specific restriction endonuclease McrA